jgi:hypothetical protein
MGPGPRFELGRKAPQAWMLPSYITPATRLCFFAWVLVLFGLSLFFLSDAHPADYTTNSKIERPEKISRIKNVVPRQYVFKSMCDSSSMATIQC